MSNTTTIAALPVGEFNDDHIRSQFEAVIRAFDRMGADLVSADPVSDEAAAGRSVQILSERNPDLLLIVALRGLSAPIIETAAQISHVPCLIWPIQGGFALASSSLAAGALRRIGDSIRAALCSPRPSRSYGSNRRIHSSSKSLWCDKREPHRRYRRAFPEPGCVPV